MTFIWFTGIVYSLWPEKANYETEKESRRGGEKRFRQNNK